MSLLSLSIDQKVQLSPSQGCQLLRIAWRARMRNQNMKKKMFNFNISVLFASASVKLVYAFNFKKSDKQRKKTVIFSLMREILHDWRD